MGLNRLIERWTFLGTEPAGLWRNRREYKEKDYCRADPATLHLPPSS
jgi:hypothetical protein